MKNTKILICCVLSLMLIFSTAILGFTEATKVSTPIDFENTVLIENTPVITILATEKITVEPVTTVPVISNIKTTEELLSVTPVVSEEIPEVSKESVVPVENTATVEHKITFEFYQGENLINSQSISNGMILKFVSVNNVPKNQEFTGWYVQTDFGSNNYVKLGFDKKIEVTASGKLRVEARFATIKKTPAPVTTTENSETTLAKENIADEPTTSTESKVATSANTENQKPEATIETIESLDNNVALAYTEALDPTQEPSSTEETNQPVEEEKFRNIEIYSNMGPVINHGDTIMLNGVLIGYEGDNYILQWQYFDGIQWNDIVGANEISYSFAADAIKLSYQWRLKVDIISATN